MVSITYFAVCGNRIDDQNTFGVEFVKSDKNLTQWCLRKYNHSFWTYKQPYFKFYLFITDLSYVAVLNAVTTCFNKYVEGDYLRPRFDIN